MGLIAVNASHSTGSTTHNLAELATEIHGSGTVYDLAALDPAALIGVGKDPTVSELLESIPQASVLVFVTPIYRATFSGLLKVVLDQLPQAALRGIPVVLAATAASTAHFLALDTGGRALVASLEGWTVPTVVYATPADFDESKRPSQLLRDQLTTALSQAAVIGRV